MAAKKKATKEREPTIVQKQFWQHIHDAVGLLAQMTPNELMGLMDHNNTPCAVDELARHAATMPEVKAAASKS